LHSVGLVMDISEQPLVDRKVMYGHFQGVDPPHELLGPNTCSFNPVTKIDALRRMKDATSRESAAMAASQVGIAFT